jgi:hypothetical protein
MGLGLTPVSMMREQVSLKAKRPEVMFSFSPFVILCALRV